MGPFSHLSLGGTGPNTLESKVRGACRPTPLLQRPCTPCLPDHPASPASPASPARPASRKALHKKGSQKGSQKGPKGSKWSHFGRKSSHFGAILEPKFSQIGLKLAKKWSQKWSQWCGNRGPRGGGNRGGGNRGPVEWKPCPVRLACSLGVRQGACCQVRSVLTWQHVPTGMVYTTHAHRPSGVPCTHSGFPTIPGQASHPSLPEPFYTISGHFWPFCQICQI